MSKKIIIAEDETLTRLDIKEMLIENSYDVIGEASDGIDALKLCREKNPDIVLLDIKMPLMNGLQVAKILKDEGFKGCIIILTAYNLKEYIEDASKNYVMGYLIKPIDEEIFLSRLNMIYTTYLRMEAYREEGEKIKKKLEERKFIEKAKGKLMKKYNCSEDEAYKKIRNLSMKKRISMLELANIILSSGEIEI